jgi:hypothetical protein
MSADVASRGRDRGTYSQELRRAKGECQVSSAFAGSAQESRLAVLPSVQLVGRTQVTSVRREAPMFASHVLSCGPFGTLSCKEAICDLLCLQ